LRTGTGVRDMGALWLSERLVQDECEPYASLAELQRHILLQIDGPLTTCVATVKATLNEIEASIAIQNEGFENLIAGSNVTMEQVLQRSPCNWYIESQEALALGLIRGVL
jgi:hypothetical protein